MIKKRKNLANVINENLNPLVVVLISIIFIQAVIILHLAISQKRLKGLEEKKEFIARVALVIDDWGYSRRNFSHLDKIDVPLTLSILPGHRYSQQVADYAQKRNWEVILHLPLEPQSSKEYSRLEPNTILTSMKDDEVLKILNKDLDLLPSVVGVSNHMGSKATASERLMKIILAELLKRNLFFLDSLVISRTISRKVARDLGIGYISRDVFLDNEQEYDYILGQFEELIRLAKRKTKAVGIAHDRKITLKVLVDILSKFDFEKQAIEFVFVSELVE